LEHESDEPKIPRDQTLSKSKFPRRPRHETIFQVAAVDFLWSFAVPLIYVLVAVGKKWPLLEDLDGARREIARIAHNTCKK
jgi:hypothetical protein